jgi:hypothetical protein
VLGNGHAGFGGRSGETHRWKHRQGAPGRPYRAEGKHHVEAVIALARRRVNVLWALLRDRRCCKPPTAGPTTYRLTTTLGKSTPAPPDDVTANPSQHPTGKRSSTASTAIDQPTTPNRRQTSPVTC